MTSSRFEDLQRRCQRLKRIRIIKIVLFFTAISLMIGCYFYLYQPITNVSSSTNASMLQAEAPSNIPQAEKSMPAKSTQEEKKNSDENLSYENEKQAYDTLLLAPKVKHTQALDVPSEEKIVLEPPKQDMKDFTLNEELKAPSETKKVLNMSVKSLGLEESLLKSFRSNNTFKTAYDLAQYYFEAKEYPKAIAWSKEASKLEPTSDKPWIIYAKAKFHLGDKTEAVRALELFLSYASSKEAQELLNFYKGQL